MSYKGVSKEPEGRTDMPDHGLEITIKDFLKTYSTGFRGEGEYEMSYLSTRTLNSRR